jgi:hypothetical protein
MAQPVGDGQGGLDNELAESLDSIRVHFQIQRGDADSGNGASGLIAQGSSYADQVAFCLSIVQGVSPIAGFLKFFTQIGEICNGVRRE